MTTEANIKAMAHTLPAYDDDELQRRYRALDKIMTALAVQYRRDGDPFSTENLELFAENLAGQAAESSADLIDLGTLENTG